ncbi:MAG: hypothetical protein AAGU32_14510, partial [Bacillota bacterium]
YQQSACPLRTESGLLLLCWILLLWTAAIFNRTDDLDGRHSAGTAPKWELGAWSSRKSYAIELNSDCAGRITGSPSDK